jgi:hypothetical protein
MKQVVEWNEQGIEAKQALKRPAKRHIESKRREYQPEGGGRHQARPVEQYEERRNAEPNDRGQRRSRSES